MQQNACLLPARMRGWKTLSESNRHCFLETLDLSYPRLSIKKEAVGESNCEERTDTMSRDLSGKFLPHFKCPILVSL